MKRGTLAAALCVISVATLQVRAPTGPDISASDLRARLEVFAHDSMQGRRTGTRGHARATGHLVTELTRMGANPAGERGAYTQMLPLTRYDLDVDSARILVAWNQYAGNLDSVVFQKGFYPGLTFLPIIGEYGVTMPLEAHVPASSVLPLLYGGRLGTATAIAPRLVRGNAVMFAPPLRRSGQPEHDLWVVRDELIKYQHAKLILVATLDLMPPSVIARLSGPRLGLVSRDVDLQRMPPIVAISRGMLALVADVPLEQHSAAVVYTSRLGGIESPANNIIAVIEGSDRDLRSEFVLISANSDHRGIADSFARGTDRVYNGADGGGSGAVALLEIAEHIAAMPVKPKRSIAFIWTAGHDQGFLGSEYFIDHPTVSRDKIVASLTLQGIGRGRGDSLFFDGASRLSTEWHGVIDSVARQGGFTPVSTATSDDVCAGDDWNYTRRGIPSARVWTSRHMDLQSVRDDVARIDFASLERTTRLIAAIVEHAANRIDRPQADKAKPDPRRPCAS